MTISFVDNIEEVKELVITHIFLTFDIIND